MAIVEIIKLDGDFTPKILRTKCQKVQKNTNGFDEETKRTIRNLLDTAIAAKNPAAAGLSAPQIGIDKQICVVRDFLPDPKNPKNESVHNYVLVNPKVITTSKETDIQWEACLSIPDLFGAVERPVKIKLKAQDEEGNEFRMKAYGWFARVILHEIDHLNGVLYTDKTIGPPKTESEIQEMLERPQE